MALARILMPQLSGTERLFHAANEDRSRRIKYSGSRSTSNSIRAAWAKTVLGLVSRQEQRSIKSVKPRVEIDANGSCLSLLVSSRRDSESN